jgi:hypothetical protein
MMFTGHRIVPGRGMESKERIAEELKLLEQSNLRISLENGLPDKG